MDLAQGVGRETAVTKKCILVQQVNSQLRRRPTSAALHRYPKTWCIRNEWWWFPTWKGWMSRFFRKMLHKIWTRLREHSKKLERSFNIALLSRSLLDLVAACRCPPNWWSEIVRLKYYIQSSNLNRRLHLLLFVPSLVHLLEHKQSLYCTIITYPRTPSCTTWSANTMAPLGDGRLCSLIAIAREGQPDSK